MNKVEEGSCMFCTTLIEQCSIPISFLLLCDYSVAGLCFALDCSQFGYQDFGRHSGIKQNFPAGYSTTSFFEIEALTAELFLSLHSVKSFFVFL